MSARKLRIQFTGLLCLTLLNCSSFQREPTVEKWPELHFIVDGKVEIQFRVPPAKAEAELFEPQFISTVIDPIQRMAIASYDPGSWSNRGLLLTNIAGTIFRLEPNQDQDNSLTLEDLKDDIYLSHEDAAKHFDIAGEYTFNDRRWLRVNLIGSYRRGISYGTIVGKHYALVLSVTLFGEESDKTRLFQTRHETLKEVIGTAKIWP